MAITAQARVPRLRLRLPAPSRNDALIAAAVGTAQVLFTTLAAGHQGDRAAVDAGAYALLIASAAALLARRSHPTATLAFAFATTLAYWLLDYPRGPIFIAVIVAFGTVVARGRRRTAWASLALAYVGFLWLGALVGVERLTPGKAIALAVWLLALGAGAEFVRARRERAIVARRARKEESLRRAGEERLRIARELHDVLAHNVSLINVQAGVALHLLDKQPEQAAPALAAIKQASAETLREMRSVLGTLRRADEQAPRDPAPSLDRLDELVRRMKAAGLELTIAVEGERRPLLPAIDLAAYRIVQEAATNVARHSGEAAARVQLRYRDRDLVLEISNGGRRSAAGPVPEGNGIVGMRERAVGLGGEFDAGPRAGGGFSVRARLPLERER
jgi:signal transduction histidine kinase